VAAAIARYALPVLAISAVTGEGVLELLRRVQAMLDALPAAEAAPEALIELAPAPDRKAFTIDEIEEGVWLVEGVEIEKVVKMTNWDYYEAGMRFQRVLNALGIRQALVEAGVEDGDSVRIGEIELVWGYENALGE
jgi:GTP-binding protein